MTTYEKVVVSAYTGYLMCDFSEVHKYIEEKLGRPVWTHELANPDVQQRVMEASRADFLKICGQNEKEEDKKYGFVVKKEDERNGEI